MNESNLSAKVYIPKQSDLFRNNKDDACDKSSLFNAQKDRYAVIEASAGTGKTFALVELVLEMMLDQNILLNSILLVTFTEKATAELRLRLRSKLHELIEIADNKPENFQQIPTVPYWIIDNLQNKKLKAALLDFDSIPIHTIHGFCNRVLREFAFENRQLFEQQHIDTSQIFPDIFRRYLRKNLLSNSHPVSPLFAIFIKHVEGKLDSLEADIVTLLSKEGEFYPMLPPFENFMLEFEECWQGLLKVDLSLRSKNAITQQHPVREAFDLTAIDGRTMKNVIRNCDLLLSLLGEAHAGRSTTELFSQILSLDFKSITEPKTRKIKSGEVYENTDAFPDQEHDWILKVKNITKLFVENNLQGDAQKTMKAWLIQEVLAEIKSELEKNKLEQGVFDFDDLLRLVHEQVVPNALNPQAITPLCKVIREKFNCAIVDEFQDTDRGQWSIFRQLFLESQNHRLIVIGDPKQAIYSFRGADVFTYLKARQQISDKTGRPAFSLKNNYRSSKELLSGLNLLFAQEPWFPENRGITYKNVGCGNQGLKLIDNNKKRNAVHLFHFQPHFWVNNKIIEKAQTVKNPKVAPEILELMKPLTGKRFIGENPFLAAISKVMESELVVSNQKGLISIFLEQNKIKMEHQFADAIAAEIKSLLASGAKSQNNLDWHDGNESRTINHRDICVLFRKAKEGELLGEALRQQGITFALYKQKGLFQGREANDILDLLEAIAHPNDPSRQGKLWLTRFLDVEIQELSNAVVGNPDLLQLLQNWKSLAEERRFRRIFDQVLEKTRLVERELFFGGNERTVTNYIHLFEVLNQQVIEKHLDLLELINLLRRYIEQKVDPGKDQNLLRLESEKNAVQLMTMHSAKGLEFPIVFLFTGLSGFPKNSIQFYHDAAENPIIDMISSAVPEEYQWQAQAEQQRLLYVAMTRTGGRLYLPHFPKLETDSTKKICKIDPGYNDLNEQLSQIQQQNSETGAASCFSHSMVGSLKVNTMDQFDSEKQQKLSNWVAPELSDVPELLVNVENSKTYFSKLRHKKRGFVVTSFSKMSRKSDEEQKNKDLQKSKTAESINIRLQAELGEAREADEAEHQLHANDSKSMQKVDLAIHNVTQAEIDPLPGGTQTGNLLHELLERVDFKLVRKSNSIEEWMNQPVVSYLISSLRERFGRAEETEARIAEIVWNTLRTTIMLGDSGKSPKLQLADCEQNLRETDFYFPIPNKTASNSAIYNTQSSENIYEFLEGWRVEKGFIRGSIDFVFKHQGLIYLLDWKSNRLDRYSTDVLEQEVKEHYELQLQIYTLATTYWFGLNDKIKYDQQFGGILYVFLRGVSPNNRLDSNNNGVYFKRPSWQELKSYENRLRLENY